MNTIQSRESGSTLVTLLAYLVAATIAFPIKIHIGAILVFSIAALVIVKLPTYRETIKHFLSAASLLILLHFLIIVFGLTHTSNLSQGVRELERSIYPMGMLIIIFLMQNHKVKLRGLIFAFAIGCFVLILWCVIYAWIILDYAEFVQTLIGGHEQFTRLVGIHQPLYLAVYFIAISFFLLEEIRTNHHNHTYKSRMLCIGGLVFAITMVFFLRPKAGLMIFPALLFLYSVLILNKRGWFFAFLIFVVSAVLFLVDKNSTLKAIDAYGETVSIAFDHRIHIWQGALEGIQSSPWIGAGTGGAQDLLNNGYESIGYQEGIVNEFNAHNQYLQFVARNGVLELFVFITLLAYSFWRSTKQANYAFLMFNMLVAFVMITESFLHVQKGIAFFYFFLLAFSYLDIRISDRTQPL